MAHHPCGRVPSVPGLVDPEEVDVQVEVGRQVPRRHPREAPQAALELGAQVVHVGPVCLTLVAAVPGQRVVRPLRSWIGSDPGNIQLPVAFLARAELGFPWPRTTATEFLWTSIATQAQGFSRDRSRLCTCS